MSKKSLNIYKAELSTNMLKKSLNIYCVTNSFIILKPDVYSWPIAAGGDSGSPMYYKQIIDKTGNEYAIVVGILWGPPKMVSMRQVA